METTKKKAGKKLEKISPLVEVKPANVSDEAKLLIIHLLGDKFGDKYRNGIDIDFADPTVKHDINLLAKDVTKFLETDGNSKQKQFQSKSIFNLLNNKGKSAIVPTHDKLSAYWLVTNSIITKEDFIGSFKKANYNGKDGEFWKKYLEMIHKALTSSYPTSESQEKVFSFETKIQRDFFSNFGSALRENNSLKKGVVTSYKKIIAEQNKVHLEDAVKFIVAIPSLLGHYLYKANPKFRISEKEAESLSPISQSESFVLCHALSIHSDSIFLLADLGRFLRLAKVFRKKYKLFLTDVDFAELNWSAQRYSDLPGVDIRKLLEYCGSFRKKLYARFDFEDTTPLGRGNIQNEIVNLDTHKITKYSTEYHLLAKEIIGEFPKVEKLDKTEVIQALEKIDLFMNNPPANHKFSVISQFDIFKDDFQKHIDAIRLVIEKFKSYSEETFSYFLLQYYHQFRYNNSLKIACEREKDFDETFRVLMKTYNSKNHEKYVLHGIYFDEYEVGVTSENEFIPVECCGQCDKDTLAKKEMIKKLHFKSVHPYYFPSGKLLKEIPELSEAEKHVILLKDSKQKIKEIFHRYKNQHWRLNSLLADLLSFAHFFFINDKSNRRTEFNESLIKLLKQLSEGLADSWTHYTLNAEIFNESLDSFEENLFSYFGHQTIIPYWIYPLLLTPHKDKSTDKSIKINVFNQKADYKLSLYAEITHLILIELKKDLSFDHWGVSQQVIL